MASAKKTIAHQPKGKGLLFSLVLIALLQADNGMTASLSQTQTKLQDINDKISLLRRTLASAHDRRGALNKELAATEKQMGEGVHQLYTIQKLIRAKEKKITVLEHKVNDLSQQLSRQQNLLAGHVRARYEMGEYQPLKWLLNQEDPYKINRLLTYYQYIIKSRKQLITQIGATRKKLNEHKTQMDCELAKNEQLKHEVLEHQQRYATHQTYRHALLESLESEIENKEQALINFENDKKSLSRLLVSLQSQTVLPGTVSFADLRKQLPFPIKAERNKLMPMNQGVTFFADEGAEVTAVYPGKVVFSDWLRGYGLLLIVDHGNGFMTLYAHNQSLFKNKGQRVSQNEHIANVGHSGGIKQNGLYFEIRLQGKAISPLGWIA